MDEGRFRARQDLGNPGSSDSNSRQDLDSGEQARLRVGRYDARTQTLAPFSGDPHHQQLFLGLPEHQSKHCIPDANACQELQKHTKVYAWVLEGSTAYKEPRAYKKERGCAKWVTNCELHNH